MKVVDKMVEIETAYATIGKSAEQFILDEEYIIAAKIFGDSVSDVLHNRSNYSIVDVSSLHRAGDIVFLKTTMSSSDEVSVLEQRVEVKAISYPYKKNVVLETKLPAYIDARSGQFIPEQAGFFLKRGVDWYAFVYNDIEGYPQRLMLVNENELWNYYQENKEKYPAFPMGYGMNKAYCLLIPCCEIEKHCESTKIIYCGSAVKVFMFQTENKQNPAYIGQVSIQVTGKD
ncbi:MAG: hypothetical protein ACOX6Y_06505 [Christensenellales bacterium]|jgi:hypothetical protein